MHYVTPWPTTSIPGSFPKAREQTLGTRLLGPEPRLSTRYDKIRVLSQGRWFWKIWIDS